MYNKNIKSFILLFVLINIIHGFISSRIPHSSFPRVDDKFIKTNIKQFNNFDAWTCYRIGQAFYNQDKYNTSILFFQQ